MRSRNAILVGLAATLLAVGAGTRSAAAQDLKISSVTPDSGPASGTTEVFIFGSDFEPSSSVSFGNALATVTHFGNPGTLTVSSPSLVAGSLNDVTIHNSDESQATLVNAWLADFLDVPGSDGFHDYVEAIFRLGITAGYGNGLFGRNDPVRREQAAVLLLRTKHGLAYVPPHCVGIFADVPCLSRSLAPTFADYIEELYHEGITSGCASDPQLRFCPDRAVSRAEMAVLVLRTEHVMPYMPPPCTAAGTFDDVPCTPGVGFSDWIDQFALEGVTAGCGDGNYCPDSLNTRGEIAVFLGRAFHLVPALTPEQPATPRG
jgi:hypothetical protein